MLDLVVGNFVDIKFNGCWHNAEIIQVSSKTAKHANESNLWLKLLV